MFRCIMCEPGMTSNRLIISDLPITLLNETGCLSCQPRMQKKLCSVQKNRALNFKKGYT